MNDGNSQRKGTGHSHVVIDSTKGPLTNGNEREDDTSFYQKRIPSSARRYHSTGWRNVQSEPLVRRASAGEDTNLVRTVPTLRRHQWTPSELLLPIGIAMVLVLSIAVGGNWLLSRGQRLEDDLHYGNPRTFQVNMVVGHRDNPIHPSHFIALNLHGAIIVLEFPGGDPTHVREYPGPVLYGSMKDVAVVTLTFRDINDDGKVDMIIVVRGEVSMPYLNDGESFRSLRPGEQVQLTI